MLTRQQKAEQAEKLRAELEGVGALFVLENKGLKVRDVDQLRSRIRKIEATYKVYKNSVVRLATKGTPMEALAGGLEGPNAFAYTSRDPVELAKVLRDFMKEYEGLAFKGAYLEGAVLGPEEAAKVADLPTKEELVAKLMFLLQSPMRRLVTALAAPVTNLVAVLKQVAEKQEQEAN